MSYTSPEKNLWAAVLDRAIEDLSHKKPLVREKAKVWFNEGKKLFQLCDIEGCDPQIGSFLWICTILNLEPNLVKKMVFQDLIRRTPLPV